MKSLLCLPWKVSIRHPVPTLFLLCAITLGFASVLPGLQLETDLMNHLPKESHDYIRNEEMRELFGLTNPVIVGVVNEERGIFNPETLRLVDYLSTKVEEIPGILPEKTKSLATLDNISGTPEGLEVRPFMNDIPKSPGECQRVRDRVYENGLYVGSVVSEDATATTIVVEISDDIDKEEFYLALKALAAGAPRGPGDEVFIAGQQILEGTAGLFVRSDLKILLPIVFLVLVILLYLSFGSLKGVTLPLTVVIGSTIWTLGLMTLLGIPLYTMSFVMPIILISLGTAYGIHILSRYYDMISMEHLQNRREIIGRVMSELWSPVAVASLTTATGFGSLGVSEMLPIRYMGFFTAFGILMAMFLSLTFIPAILTLMPVKEKAGHHRIIQHNASSVEHVVFRSLGYWIHDYRILVTAVFLLLIFGALWGMSRLHIDASLVRDMDPHSEVMVANSMLNGKFSGTTPLNVIVKTPDAGDIKNPDVLASIDRFQEIAEKSEMVGGSLSIADLVKLMNRVMHEGRSNEEKIPATRELIAQYFLLYSLSGEMESLESIVDDDFQQANVQLFLKSDHSWVIAGIMESLEETRRREFTSLDLDVEFLGFGQLIHSFNQRILTSQVRSALSALFIIFLLATWMFRSLSAGLFNMIPIVMSVLFNFGLMGILGIPLNTSTAIISSIGMGIGIDYAIHFVYRWKLESAKSYDIRHCISTTMGTSGKAIFFNALTISLGFFVLMLSGFPFVRELGLLLSVNMVASYLGATVAIPVVLSWFCPRSLCSKLA